MKQRGEVTGLELFTLIVITLFIVYLATRNVAHAEPKYIAQAPEGATLILDSDQCVLPEITNLPSRAVRMDEKEWLECCYGVVPQTGMVVFYCANKRVGHAPVSAFQEIGVKEEDEDAQAGEQKP